MIVAMAEFIINILPAALAKHLHLVFAFLGGFIGKEREYGSDDNGADRYVMAIAKDNRVRKMLRAGWVI